MRKMMEYKKTVSNPFLIGAIEVMKAEPSPEHRKMVSDELIKAVYLCPVTVTPEPEKNAEGKYELTKGTQVQFSMLTAPDGKHFFMAFSDMTEMKKWKDEENLGYFAMTFDDYAGLLFRKDPNGNTSPASGFVLNPFGANVVVPKEMIAQYIAAKVDRQKAAQKNGPKE